MSENNTSANENESPIPEMTRKSGGDIVTSTSVEIESAPDSSPKGPPIEIESIIQNYRIIETVSETSTSIVYKAEEKQSRRKVAIKIIYNRSLPNSDRINRARVEIERLRHLYHPGIAPLLRAGTTEEGHSFFVSQFIKGVTLNEYIGIHNLGIGDRLAVFMKLCGALNHAHQRCLLHRDLRPSNIIIDGKCNPIIVGYGVAAVTDVDLGNASSNYAKRELREFLAYKSPEQVAGKLYDIDVRSDLYSLGVILYELLTDRLPYKSDAEECKALIQAIEKEMPPKPTAIKPTLHADLEAIVLKALEKVPTARYQNVLAVSRDMDRHFEQRPVEARPAGAFYEFRKLASRHKSRFISIVATSIAVLLFGLHIHLTTQKANERLLQEERERTAAEIAHRVSSEQLAREREAKMEQMIDNEQAQRRQAEANIQSLQGRLGQAEATGQEAQIRADQAEIALAGALEIARFWPALFQKSGREVVAGERVSAVDILSKGAEAAAQAFGDRSGLRASLLNDLGLAFRNLGLANRAADLAQKAWVIRTETLGEAHVDTIAALNNLASDLFAQGKHEEAEPFCRDLARLSEQAFGEDDPRTLTAMNNLAMALHAVGKLDEAGEVLSRTVDGRRRILGKTHQKTGMSIRELALIRFDQGNVDAANDLFSQAHTALESDLSSTHWLMADIDSRRGECLVLMDQYNEAEPLLLSAYATLDQQLGPKRPQTQSALGRIVSLYTAWGKPGEAKKWSDKTGKRNTSKQPVVKKSK
ncbi:MAG: tetratricopeptide repeat protein [Phycisphaerae bacterium]